MRNKKYLVLLLALIFAIGGVVGGSLAWLKVETEPVRNTFVPSTITITLEERDTKLDGDENKNTNDYKMIPGYTLVKDPVVTVDGSSEDCWLFVKITESTNPDLDSYIAYAIASGWESVESVGVDNDGDVDNIVIGRKVYKTAQDQPFNILGAGSYTFKNGTPDNENDDITVSWRDNQVGVKPEVTETMMEAITGEGKAQPTLTFDAYAVQLYKTNNVEFTALEAWKMAPGYVPSSVNSQ